METSPNQNVAKTHAQQQSTCSDLTDCAGNLEPRQIKAKRLLPCLVTAQDEGPSDSEILPVAPPKHCVQPVGTSG